MSNIKTPCEQIPCKKPTCRPKPGRPGSEPCENPNSNLKGRPVLYTGVIWIGLVRKFLIPRTCLQCSSNSQELERKEPESNEPKYSAIEDPKSLSHAQPQPVTETHLTEVLQPFPDTIPPLSSEPEEDEHQPPADDVKPGIPLKKRQPKRSDYLNSPLTTFVVQAQEVSALAAEHAKAITEDFATLLRESKETTTGLVETVRSEDGRTYRLAAITTSGVIGFLAGIRHGVLTRVLSTATGVIAMASVCYPEEAKAYNRQGFTKARRWVVLGLSSAHSGPQKPLERADITETEDKDTIIVSGEEFEENTTNIEKLQTSKPSSGNIISLIIQNLGDKYGGVKDKLKDSFSTTDHGVSPSGGDLNGTVGESEEHSEQFYHSISDDDIKLLSEVNKGNEDVLHSNGATYSPKLPFLPGIKHKQSRHTIKEQNTLENSPKDETYLSKTNSNQHLYQNTVNELLVPDNDSENEGTLVDEDEEFSDNVIVVPTGGLDEKFGETLKKTSHHNTGNVQIKKKLISHYKDFPEHKRTSREVGYDDAYSNRG